MRLFIAIELPQDVKDVLGAATDPLRESSRGMSWVKPEALHCTLKFLGDVADPEPIKQALASMAVYAKDAVLAGYAEVFCRKDAATVFNVPFENSGALPEWFSEIEDVLLPLGFARETRRFIPHCTVARYKSYVACHDAKEQARSLIIPKGLIVPVKNIHLIKSTLLPDGPLYAILCSYGG